MANGWVQAPPVIPFAPKSDPKPEWAYFPNGPPAPPKPSPVASPSPDIFFTRDNINSPIPPDWEALNMCWTLNLPPPSWTPPTPPPAAADVTSQAPPPPPPAAGKASPPPAASIWFSGVPPMNGWTFVAPPPPPTPAPAPPARTQANQQGYYVVSFLLNSPGFLFEVVVNRSNSSTN